MATPQGHSQQAPRGKNPPRPHGPPQGGTPEPATVLLVAGAAAAYGAARMRRRKGAK